MSKNFKFGVDNVPGSSQYGQTIYSSSNGVLSISGIEQVAVVAGVVFPGGGSEFFGGDYTTLVPLWQTAIAQSAGLRESNYVIKYEDSTITPGNQTIVNGDLNGVNLSVQSIAHNGPFPDISPTVEAVPGADPTAWDGIKYEPFYSVIDGVSLTFGNTLINGLGSKGYTIAGDTSSITESALSNQNVSGTLFTYDNQTVYNFTTIQDSEAVIQNNTMVGGSNTILVINNHVTNNISGNVTTVTIEAINNATNLDNHGHLATSSQSDGIYGLATAQPIVSGFGPGSLTQVPVDMSASHNQITVIGNGDINNIYGNIAAFTELAQDTTQRLEPFSAIFSFNTYNLGGSNTIKLIGNSTNTVSGDVGQTLLSSISSDAGTSAQTAGFTSSGAAGLNENYHFGSNTIDAAASSGTNLIFGEGQSFLDNTTVGNIDPSGQGWGIGYYGGATDVNHVFISATGGSSRNIDVTAGDNTISGGTGNNTLIGDFGKFAVTMDAGNVGSANDFVNVDSVYPGFGDRGANAHAALINAQYTLGDNTLIAKGAGTNVLVGGVETLEFNLIQGHIGNSTTIGFGPNDTANHGIWTYASFSGDTGQDPLNPFSSGPTLDHGSTFAFGNNTLDATAASGKVTLIDNTMGISDQSLQNFLTNPSSLVTESDNPNPIGTINLNQILWGHGTDSGGTGTNHFDFLVANNTDLYGASNVDISAGGTGTGVLTNNNLQLLGNDTITNLGHGSDSMEFYAPVGSSTITASSTVADLKAMLTANTTFTHDGAGDTIINFNSGGSLTLDNVNITGWNDAQLTPSLVHITNDLGVAGTEYGIAFHFH
jgi:hypothetical protein